jgi:NAD(P)H dehydrogenase (quinone)
MPNILIVYATDYGNTKAMAEAVATGVNSVPSMKAVVKMAESATHHDVEQSVAVIIGTPVHMGSPDWRVKKFIDTQCSGLWMRDGAVGKIGAVFASGSGFGSAGGGCELAMLSLLANFAELGMIIVPLPKNTPGYARAGLQWGPYVRTADDKMDHTGIDPAILLSAHHHGANVARLAQSLHGEIVFAST